LADYSGKGISATYHFHHAIWAKESALLTTFITPFGRYHFNRLPFGITSAPEHFQRRMSTLLRDLEGVVCLIDDVLIYGKSQEQHDERLLAVLNRLEEAGLTLNRDKCEWMWGQAQKQAFSSVKDAESSFSIIRS
jgi:hypothetical protein